MLPKEPEIFDFATIDRELDKLPVLLEKSGYIPGIDHLVPPTVSLTITDIISTKGVRLWSAILDKIWYKVLLKLILLHLVM